MMPGTMKPIINMVCLPRDQTNGGVFNTLNFFNALRVEDDGNGGRQCADAFARDLGCVPVNVFGARFHFRCGRWTG